MSTTLTLEQRLKDCHYRPSGFDYMRIVLASLVIIIHTLPVNYGPYATAEVSRLWWARPTALILPMFFALSGFLVSGSLERSRSLVSFLGLRLFRLVPALVVEVILSALLLGPIFTSLALGEYFTHPQFFVYFQNIFGHIHFGLPGVFDDLPFPSVVNAQLWTLPWELICYIALSLAAFTRLIKRPILFAAMVIAIQLGDFARHVIFRPPVGNGAGGKTLVLAFLFGVAIYHLRDKLPWNARLFVLSLAVSLGLMMDPVLTQAAGLPVAYVTVYLGMTMPRRIPALLSGDYSYGLFLFGFPIQQSMMALLQDYPYWWLNLLTSAGAVALLAYSSWWFIEKPIHDRRKILTRLENRVMPVLWRIPILRYAVLQPPLQPAAQTLTAPHTMRA